MTPGRSPIDDVIAIVARSLRRSSEVNAESDVFALGADSLVMMSVVAQLEAQFDIEFDPEDLVQESLRTPRRIVELLGAKYHVATEAMP